MDEQLNDALEMIGMTEPRQITQEVSGFIPVFEVVLNEYKDHMTALIFGRMWQYCRMSDGVCRAALDRIANDLQISSATIIRHIEKLEAGGYILDTTPDRRNRPHEYADCGRVIMKSQLTAGVAQKNVAIAQKNVAIAESQLIKQDKTNIRQNISLSKSEMQEAGQKVDKIIAMQSQSAWQGRELIRADLLPLADCYNAMTNQVMTKRVQKSWWKALSEWKDEGLSPAHLQTAFEAQSKWRTVSDPNMLTKDAAAIKAAGEMNKESQREEGKSSGYYA